MIPETMKAVVLTAPTNAQNVQLTDYPVPRVRPGWVLVKVKAFGMNHSEKILRLSEINADDIEKPIIPGIECAGEIADASDSSFQKGQKVVLLWEEWDEVFMEVMRSMLCFRHTTSFLSIQI